MFGAAASVPLHPEPVSSLWLTVAVLVAGLGASAIVGLALAALARRQSRPYLLVTLAIGAILARTLVAGLSLRGLVDARTHHVAEHVLDVAMVGLVIAAVYTARSADVGRASRE